MDTAARLLLFTFLFSIPAVVEGEPATDPSASAPPPGAIASVKQEQIPGPPESAWIRTPPTSRHDHAMAYDSARGHVVLFGGSTPAKGRRGETWGWDGQRWALLAITGPTPRRDHAMAYDEARERVVLFGGDDDSGAFSRGDTWEWDGEEWELVSTTGPEPRREHAMAYDSARGRVVLFAGRGVEGRLWDTWEWDGQEWHLVSTTGPERRYTHAMAYDGVRNRVLLFGGSGWTGIAAVTLDDTWEWNGQEWTEIDTEFGPSPRARHAMVFDSVRQKVLLQGGTGDGSSETWEWDGETWEQVVEEGPFDRREHAMAYDAARQRVVLFGGIRRPEGIGSSESVDETWEWDAGQWEQVHSAAPPPRRDHAMAHDSARDRTVLFGGQTPFGDLVDETWEWDGRQWELAATEGPAPRRDFAMVYHTARQRTLLFGGFGGEGVFPEHLADTWEWDGEQWQEISVAPGTAPSSSQGHAMAYDPQRDRVVLFGGAFHGVGGEISLRRDTWEWDGEQWEHLTNTGPTARTDHAMAYDGRRGQVVLFGGWGAAGDIGDMWGWDGEQWEEIPIIDGPTPRRNHTMAHDSVRGRVLLFGGSGLVNGTFTRFDEMWEWNGDRWELDNAPGPAGRDNHAMAYDSARGRAVLFGGTAPITVDETWEFIPAPLVLPTIFVFY